MSKTQPARGMRDFLPADIRKREYVIGIIKDVYESYGFEPLETPAVENLETLMGKYGEEGNQLVFKILKRGEKLSELFSGDETPNSEQRTLNSLSDLALRYDLTVPLARVVANYKNDLPKFFKRYQIQPVWRADRPARGRFREFYQCDVDAIGSTSMTVEAEQINAVRQILTKLGFQDFVIKINHREFLFDILNSLNIPKELHPETLVAIDKLDKISLNDVASELIGKGVSAESVEGLKTLYAKTTEAWGDNRLMLSHIIPGNLEVKEKLAEIIEMTGDDNVGIFPFLARGLSYYTGAIMEIVLIDGDFRGSIGGGGRYDGLIGMFQKEAVPACGFSLGLERIIVVMEERGMFPPEIAESKSADVMVTIWNEESVADSLALAQEIRAQGLRVVLYPEADKMSKQFKYAGQIGVPYVIVQGDEEKSHGTVALKNMQTGDQEVIKVAEVAGKIKGQ